LNHRGTESTEIGERNKEILSLLCVSSVLSVPLWFRRPSLCDVDE
jgi:hypothetical protein